MRIILRPRSTRPIGVALGTARMVPVEARATLRDTAGLIVPLGLPLLVLFGSAMSGAFSEVVQPPYTALEVQIVPSVLTMVVAIVAVVNLPSFLAAYRRSGVLASLRVTPIPPVSVLLAQLIVSAVQMLVGVALMLVVAWTVFALRPPADALAAAGVFLLGTAAMYGVGMVVAVVSPTPNSAVAIGLVAFLGLGALGGMFGPVTALPGLLGDFARCLPYAAMSEGVQRAWTGNDQSTVALIALGSFALGGAALAAWKLRR